MNSSSNNAFLDKSMKEMLLKQYDRAVMNNTSRAAFVECLVARTLGDGWEHHCVDGLGWAAWDCYHKSSTRLEIKQSAARQLWHTEEISPNHSARFDIKPRKGYWPPDLGDDGAWIDKPGRFTDIYVFAWHGERKKKTCDHRDANQWCFYVAKEQMLPKTQKTIGISSLEEIAKVCDISELQATVEDSMSEIEVLKATLQI